MADKYIPQDIEPKWQKRWEETEIYKTGPADKRPKYYILDMYPYPSGAGMSVGHAHNYVPPDVVARTYRMRGFNVLHPMGFDAFGLPTENAAIKEKVNPHDLNEAYSANYVRQFKLMGLSFDWSRLFNTAHPSFYRWTQWIFVQLFESWYDPRKDKASPVAELEQELRERGSGDIIDYIDQHPEHVGAIGKTTQRVTAAEWNAMSRKQQNAYLMGFRLAYRADSMVNWDPVDKVVVANEEVDAQGRAWRSGAIVIKKTLRQWFFRMTAYASRLVNDLSIVDWPDKIVSMQRNWVGKSMGAEVDFVIDDGRRGGSEAATGDDGRPTTTEQPSSVVRRPSSQFPSIRVYTTRPDTLWGATFMVLSPEHPLVAGENSPITTAEQREAVDAYIAKAKGETDESRTDESKAKTGVFTGAYALNPVNNERIPIWIADYVLMTYGTGAIMAVPAHDQRDFDFARKFGLPIVQVVAAEGGKGNGIGLTEAYQAKEGVMVDSGPITGTPAGQASIDAAIAFCEEGGVGKRRVNYRIRDWLISRQRYWGTPIPIIHTADGEVTVPDSELPLRLPEVENYEPTQTGESPLATIPDYVEVKDSNGNIIGLRETDTMATWACSSWYFLRFPDPDNDKAAFNYDELKYWMPVDMYVGGAEHAVLHLLYSRMWTKVLFDLDFVPFTEPFMRLRNQGMILAPEKVIDEHGRAIFEKMSKSKGNVITPDEVVAEHGADALRAYEMFISDFAATVPWSTQGVPGVRRWLDRVWRIALSADEDKGMPQKFTVRELRRAAHQTIQRYDRDIESFGFNTIISGMMEYTNTLFKARDAGLAGTPEWAEAIDILVRLLAPVAPHMAEELWERMGGGYSIHQQSWPKFDAAAAREDEITIPVQINGKVRDRLVVAVDTDEETIKQLAVASDGAKRYINGTPPKQVIYVKGRLVNIVV